jgi:hypothetical protein
MPEEKPLTDEQALDALKALMVDDMEDDHVMADRFLCELLESLGYGKTVDFYKSLDKWYA